MRRTRNLLATTHLALFFVASAAGCEGSINAFGANPAQARHLAENAFAAFAFRFYNVQRDPNFERARNLMGQYALIPSRLWRDSSLWNGSTDDSTRTLTVGASFANNHYTFAANRQAPAPRALGDERHSLSLKWMGGSDYEWFTHVDHAIGAVTPEGVSAAIMATLTAAEGRSSQVALADARTTFPETGRHLAQLFTIDSLRTSHEGGATTTMLGVTVDPSRLRPRYPYFANFVDKYNSDAIYRIQLTDRDGRHYFDASSRNGALVIRLRSRDHRLVSLGNPSVPMPDSLTLTTDVSMKYGMFRVGLTNLVGDFTIERGEHRRAWMMRFRKEPAWHFPLAVDKLIRNPLRRPFQGRGAEFSLGVRDDAGPQTFGDRHARFVVNESAIMRWLGRLGATAFGDFTGRTELEENLFLYEMFEALRRDVIRD